MVIIFIILIALLFKRMADFTPGTMTSTFCSAVVDAFGVLAFIFGNFNKLGIVKFGTGGKV